MKSSAWWPSAIFVAPDLLGDPVQHAAPQARAERARRRVVLEDVVDDRADAGVLDAVLPAARHARPRDQIVFVLLVAGIDVHGDERESHGRSLPQHVENLKQRPAVLAARQADHHAVAVLDHRVVDDRLRRFLGDPRLELRPVRHRSILNDHQPAYNRVPPHFARRARRHSRPAVPQARCRPSVCSARRRLRPGLHRTQIPFPRRGRVRRVRRCRDR